MISSPQEFTDKLNQVLDRAKQFRDAAEALALVQPQWQEADKSQARNAHTATKEKFQEMLTDAKKFVDSQLDNIHESIKVLDGIEKSSAGTVAKADARAIRAKLESLKALWETSEGTAQQIVKFAEIGVIYPDEAEEALRKV
jgi:hypothetical protein